MNETQQKYAEKRIILSKEQEERMAMQAVQKVQAFVNEANNVQARRCEVMVALLAAHVTHAGARGGFFARLFGNGGTTKADVDHCRLLAGYAVEEDAREKFSDLKQLFAELKIEGPQPHLEWAARQVGIKLFDAPPRQVEPPRLIQPATVQAIEGKKVIQ